MDKCFNYGWILVYDYLVYQQSFWDEMGGVFFPERKGLNGRKNVSFTIDGITHILGFSDFFGDYDGDKFLAPTYNTVFDELECFSNFERTKMIL